MAKIKCFVISCSSDAELDARKLYVWGGYKHIRWLPETAGEAKKQIIECKKEYKCEICDAQIHPLELERTRLTNKQKLNIPKK